MSTGPNDDPTPAIYEAEAERWRAEREPPDHGPAQAFAGRVRAARADGVPARPVADLGCGPGWFTEDLVTGATAGTEATAVALDRSAAMLALVPRYAPAAARVQASLTALPFRRGGLGGAFANKSYVHVAQTATPLALADLHRATAVGAPVELLLFEGDVEHGPHAADDFPGRRFSQWPRSRLADVVVGAGFTLHHIDASGRSGLRVLATRARTLPDTVGPGMRLLVCGLNPSVYSADVGTGFARPGNRYWPAALAAGLVARDRDPWDALRSHGVGMTDVVKRATARADELSPDEYREGMARVGRLVEWLRPRAVCFVGLAGWRAAVDRKAVAGLQPEGLGGVPVHVMPSTSGLNAHSSLDDLTAHLRAAAALADS